MVDEVDATANTLITPLEPFRTLFEDLPMETIRPEKSFGAISGACSAVGADRGGGGGSLEFEGLLGEGGMGTIHLANQRSTGRRVAVKRVRPELASSTQEQALLSEGWIMAALEHPNIPPVHDIIVDANGAPMVVLKRIEGTDWGALMFDEELVLERFGESLIDWNLSILHKVCDAINYAHSKGIVHRDLKPSNIMVGAFGEVYVLDWGIAVGLTEDPSSRVPFVGDSSQPAGTPYYMAPELLFEDASDVGLHTDIYLLGGLLFEVLTGDPPHKRESMSEIIASVTGSPPRLPESVPAGLAAICTHAMQFAPSRRLASVEEFQQALRHFQKTRSTQMLLDDADARFESLRALVASSPSRENAAEVTAQFRECCFAFRQALLLSPANAHAQGGLQACIEFMASEALEQGRLESARALLEELSDVDAELMQRLKAAEAARQAADAEDEAVVESLLAQKLDGDVRVGQRARGSALLVIGVGWFVAMFVMGALQRAGIVQVSNTALAATQGVILLGLGVATLIGRGALLTNQASRGVMVGLFAVIAGCFALFIVGATLPLSVPTTLGLAHIICWTGVLVSTPYDRRFAPGVVLLPFGITILWIPNYALEISGATTLLTLGAFYWMMRPPGAMTEVEARTK